MMSSCSVLIGRLVIGGIAVLREAVFVSSAQVVTILAIISEKMAKSFTVNLTVNTLGASGIAHTKMI